MPQPPIAGRPTRRRLAPVAALAAAALLASCSGESTPEQTADGAPEGGTAVVALDNSVTCLDPQQATAFAGLLIVQHTVDQLTYANPETAELEPWLASEWSVNEDSTEFTFTLREGVTFSDGSDLDADAVARNLTEIAALGASSQLGSSYLAGFTGASAESGQVVVTFEEPNAQFLQATSTTTLGILSEASYDNTPEERCLGSFSGTGPFTVESFAPDSEAVIERRSGYDWAPASIAHSGDARLERIEFPIVLEAGVRTGLLTSGQADAVAGVFREDEASFQNDDYWLQARANPGFTNSLVVNERSEILADPAVREALQVAIDRQEVVDAVSSSTAVAATGLLTSTAPFATDYSDLLTLDVDRANELLAGAGWVAGEDGVRVKEGVRLSLRVVHFPAQSELVALLNQQFHTVGAELVSEVIDPAQREEIEAAGNFDLLQRNLTRADPDVLRNQLGFAYSNYLYRDAPDELDELLDAQAATTDVQARQALVDEIQERVLGDNLVWPVSELTQVFAGSAALQGTHLDSSSRLNLYTAWLED